MKKRRRSCHTRKYRQLGFIMLAFGIITLCAFFLPMQIWLVLLSVLLIYCGYLLWK